MTVTTDLKEEIRTRIQANIRDPNNSRREEGKTWVYTLPIDVSIPTYPRVYIHPAGNTRTARAVNSTRRKDVTLFDVKVLWHLNDKYDPLDTDQPEMEPQYAVQDFAEHIASYIDDNQALWRAISGVESVVSISINKVDSGKNNVLRRDIQVRARTSSKNFTAVT